MVSTMTCTTFMLLISTLLIVDASRVAPEGLSTRPQQTQQASSSSTAQTVVQVKITKVSACMHHICRTCVQRICSSVHARCTFSTCGVRTPCLWNNNVCDAVSWHAISNAHRSSHREPRASGSAFRPGVSRVHSTLDTDICYTYIRTI